MAFSLLHGLVDVGSEIGQKDFWRLGKKFTFYFYVLSLSFFLLTFTCDYYTMAILVLACDWSILVMVDHGPWLISQTLPYLANKLFGHLSRCLSDVVSQNALTIHHLLHPPTSSILEHLPFFSLP